MSIKLTPDQQRALDNLNCVMPTALRAEDVATWTADETRAAEAWYYGPGTGTGPKIPWAEFKASAPSCLVAALISAEKARAVELAEAARAFLAADKLHDQAEEARRKAAFTLSQLARYKSLFCDGQVIRWAEGGYVVERPIVTI